MTTTTHTAIGIVIGTQLINPALAFILGLITHLLIDIIPHGDSFIYNNLQTKGAKKMPIIYGFTDSIIGIILIVTFFTYRPSPHTMTIFFAIFGSVLPDVIVGLNELFKSKILKQLTKIHFYFHDFFLKKQKDIKLSYALIAQIAFIAIILKLA